MQAEEQQKREAEAAAAAAAEAAALAVQLEYEASLPDDVKAKVAAALEREVVSANSLWQQGWELSLQDRTYSAAVTAQCRRKMIPVKLAHRCSMQGGQALTVTLVGCVVCCVAGIPETEDGAAVPGTASRTIGSAAAT